MVQKYTAPVRVYKYPFELVMAVSESISLFIAFSFSILLTLPYLLTHTCVFSADHNICILDVSAVEQYGQPALPRQVRENRH